MIFEDRLGKRQKWAISGAVLLAVAALVPVSIYFLGLRLAPHLTASAGPAIRSSGSIGRATPTPTVTATAPGPHAAYVFAANDDPPGARSIDAHLSQMDVIVPDWFRLPGSGCEVTETVDDASRRWATRSDVGVVARLANLRADAWAKEEAGAMLRQPETRRCVIEKVTARAHALHARGVNVDLESLSADDAANLVDFMRELRAALGPHDLLSIDVTPGDPAYDLARLGKIADAVILMAYDEHEETSAPGPIASTSWFAGVVDQARALVPADRLVAGIGSYCYDWQRRDGRTIHAEPLGFEAAMERAANGTTPTFDDESGGSRFTYADHEVWCGDALSAHNQQKTLAARGLARWALWRAGSEDPSLWSTSLGSIAAPEAPSVHGSGDGWIMTTPPRTGERDVVLASNGSVQSAIYRVVPRARAFERRGGNARREVVLTFDDGPDPIYTPRVLDTLRDLDAPAAFFVLGDQAMKYPELVRRIDREGHVVGNHSFRHPHIDQIGEDGLLLELRSTERVLEGELGHYTPFFRAPYTAAFDAAEPELLASHLPAFEAGYDIVGGDVDPADWEQPGAAVIAERIVAQVESGGRIVVLHDAGGDRTQTVEALQAAIPRLRARGYPIVSLDRHLGVARGADVDTQDRTIATGARAASIIAAHGPTLLGLLFTACTGLASMRVLMMVLLALKKRREAPELEPGKEPLVTVLVPAYNEEKVLRSTVESLLGSRYPNLEILVIDDGSKDGTYAIGGQLAREHERVRCITKKNGGKAAASNHGIEHARGDILVCVDADTLIHPDAIGLLARHFADPKISAVCGNVEVGNVHSALTAFQAIEYVTSQNLDRRALASVNAVNVVPGALGAWRKEVLVGAGKYAHDTLVEDADLTLAVLRNGGRIEYEPKAIARTEAPETLSALWKQRFRWTYGTYQCLAKHRHALLRGPAGLIALPNMILFQVLFPLLSPIGDAVMLIALFSGNWRSILSGYVGFLAMDMLASAVAFKLDDKPLRWLPLLLVQRFTYRQFMYLVCLRAIVAAIAGRRHGWRKLERLGTATLAAPVIITPEPALATVIPLVRTTNESLPPPSRAPSRLAA
ncbi:MAG: glycosyltransferase [Labilithrix sp.]